MPVGPELSRFVIPKGTPLMAQILFTPIGTLGDLHPYLAIATHLMQRGHRPIIATMEAYREKVESAGLSFHSVGPHFRPDDREKLEYLLHPTRGTARLFRDFIVPYMEEAFGDILPAMEKADLYISHPLSFSGIAAARKAGTPWVSSVLAPISMMSVHDRGVFPGPIPVHRLRFLGPMYYKFLIGLGKLAFMPVEKKVTTFFASHGLTPPRHPIFEDQHSPLGVLALFSSVIGEPQPDWPANTSQTGFSFFDEGAGELAHELAGFLAAGEPPIVFTLGSAAVQLAGDFFDVATAALAQTPHRAVYLVGKGMAPPKNIDPERIMVREYAPFEALLPRASLVVHSGGIGTVAQVLRAGKPSLVVPFANDQFDNADRISRMGFGAWISRKSWSNIDASIAIDGLMIDESIRENCLQAAGRIGEEDGALRAAEKLEEFLHRR